MSIPPNQFRRDHPWTRFVLVWSRLNWLGGILRTKRVQGWSRLNWLDGILIVSWHIHFNKLLMPLTPVCCFAN